MSVEYESEGAAIHQRVLWIRNLFPAAGLRLKDEYWCCGSLQYRTATATLHVGPARARVNVPRACVVIARATAGNGACVCTRCTSGGDCVRVCCAWTPTLSGESAPPVVAAAASHRMHTEYHQREGMC
jgi:hypothetical protein